MVDTSTIKPKKRLSVSLLSNEQVECLIRCSQELDLLTPVFQVRCNVVLEIITTERDYVRHLNDIVEGYLVPIKRHKEMFNEERVARFVDLQIVFTVYLLLHVLESSETSNSFTFSKEIFFNN